MTKPDTVVTPEPPARGSILFADDDAQVRSGVGQCLIRAGFACDFASSGAEAAEALGTKEYDVLLSDINMPGNSQLELIEKMPGVSEGLPVILLTGSPTVETASRSVRLRVMAYLTKPPDMDELCRLLDAAVAERRNLRVLKDSRQRLQDWEREIGRIQALLQQVTPANRQATMQSYVRLTLRQLVVGLMDLEHLLIHDGERLGTDTAVEKQELINAVRKTISVLGHTKDHFKSKELGELRKELENLLR
jgi:DNA-binding response OmpR family regulator